MAGVIHILFAVSFCAALTALVSADTVAKGDRGGIGARGEPKPPGRPGNRGNVEEQKGLDGKAGPSGGTGEHGNAGCDDEERHHKYLLYEINLAEEKLAMALADPDTIGDPGQRGVKGFPGVCGQKGESYYMKGIKGRDGPPGSVGLPGRRGRDCDAEGNYHRKLMGKLNKVKDELTKAELELAGTS